MRTRGKIGIESNEIETMQQKPIQDIVSAFQAGSREAFAELVRHYQNLVTSIAYAHIGDLQRSEDIAQQTFIVAWQKQNENVEPDRFGAWLRGIANNLARNENRLKENVRQKTSVSLKDRHVTAGSNPESETSQREQSELLWATLDKIPLEYREPLVLFYRSDKSVAEVAEQMDLSQSAVKQRLKRGRAMVKQEIALMVDEFLSETRPSRNFASLVIAALPAVGSKAGLSAIKAGAAISGTKVVGSKVTTAATVGAVSTLSIAGLITIIASGFGFAVGLGVGWLRTKKIVDRSTSQAEEQVHWNSFTTISLVVALFSAIVVVSSLIQLGQYAGLIFGFVGPVFMHWATLYPMKKELKLRRLYQVHGVPEHLKGKSQERMFPKMATHSNGGMIGGIIGAWGWLLLLLLGGSFLHWSIFLFFVAGTTIFVWLIAVASREIEEEITFAEEIRIQSDFIWKAILIQAGFCAIILLVYSWQRTGFQLIQSMQMELDWESISTLLQVPSQGLALLSLVCPYLILFGFYLRWLSFTKANIAEEEESIGWDLGDGKIVFTHPSDAVNSKVRTKKRAGK